MMSDSQKTFVRCVVVLSCIALLSGLLLGLFHQITAISAEEQIARAVKKIEEIRPGSYEPIETKVPLEYETGRVESLFRDTETEGVYAVLVVGNGGYGGTISVTVIIETDMVTDFRIGTNKETPGVSDSALKNEDFLRQFKRPIAELDAMLNGDTEGIDSATGATYSSRGTKNAFATLASFWKLFEEEEAA